MDLKKLCCCPKYLETAAQWFSKKWGNPAEAYRESMQDSVRQYAKQKYGIPQWYIVSDSNDRIIAGAGIIGNDFHDRRDLSPNLCALFVEEEYRRQGIAGYILDTARKDAGRMGFDKLYLVTDHTEFYEKCGWEFLTMVNDDEGIPERMYVASTHIQKEDFQP